MKSTRKKQQSIFLTAQDCLANSYVSPRTCIPLLRINTLIKMSKDYRYLQNIL